MCHQCQVFGVSLRSSNPPFCAGQKHIRVKKVRHSKTWIPPAKPQPREEDDEEEDKREELEKRKEVKPVPKSEPGKMCSGDSSRLTRKNFPGTSGQDFQRRQGSASSGNLHLDRRGKRNVRPWPVSIRGKEREGQGHKGISPLSLLCC